MSCAICTSPRPKYQYEQPCLAFLNNGYSRFCAECGHEEACHKITQEDS